MPAKGTFSQRASNVNVNSRTVPVVIRHSRKIPLHCRLSCFTRKPPNNVPPPPDGMVAKPTTGKYVNYHSSEFSNEFCVWNIVFHCICAWNVSIAQHLFHKINNRNIIQRPSGRPDRQLSGPLCCRSDGLECTAWQHQRYGSVNLLFQTLSEDSSFLLLLAYQRIRGFVLMLMGAYALYKSTIDWLIE